MADIIETKDHETPPPPRPLHEAGSFVAQCVDVINLGKRPETYQGEDKGLVSKLALVFRTGEMDDEGKPIDLDSELNVSTGEKATLRKWAEAWRGEPYPEEYPNIPVHLFEGCWAIITVAHKTSGSGKTYAKITGVTKLAKGQKGGESFLPSYERAEWWQKRKDAYAKECQEYTAKHQPSKPTGKAKPAPDFEDFPAAMDEDPDDLPF
jgi:hypothetical protein